MAKRLTTSNRLITNLTFPIGTSKSAPNVFGVESVADRLRIFEIRKQAVVSTAILPRSIQPSHQEKPRSVSGRFLFHPGETRIRGFDITICDIKRSRQQSATWLGTPSFAPWPAIQQGSAFNQQSVQVAGPLSRINHHDKRAARRNRDEIRMRHLITFATRGVQLISTNGTVRSNSRMDWITTKNNTAEAAAYQHNLIDFRCISGRHRRSARRHHIDPLSALN